MSENDLPRPDTQGPWYWGDDEFLASLETGNRVPSNETNHRSIAALHDWIALADERGRIIDVVRDYCSRVLQKMENLSSDYELQDESLEVERYHMYRILHILVGE